MLSSRAGKTIAPRLNRRINHIEDWIGTAVNIQAMVFGNLGEGSGTGVGFNAQPRYRRAHLFRRVPDERAGRGRCFRRPHSAAISELEKAMPKVFEQLKDITRRMEKHYRDMQDFEFTIQDGKLYMLQTRNGKRTGLAAVRVAIDMVREGLITQEEAIFRVEPNQLYDFLVPRLVEKGEKIEVLATGAAGFTRRGCWPDCFTAEEAVSSIRMVRIDPSSSFAAKLRLRTSPAWKWPRNSDFAGGMTSHAACRYPRHGQMLRAGAGDCVVDESEERNCASRPTYRQRLAFDDGHGKSDRWPAEDARKRSPTTPIS